MTRDIPAYISGPPSGTRLAPSLLTRRIRRFRRFRRRSVRRRTLLGLSAGTGRTAVRTGRASTVSRGLSSITGSTGLLGTGFSRSRGLDFPGNGVDLHGFQLVGRTGLGRGTAVTGPRASGPAGFGRLLGRAASGTRTAVVRGHGPLLGVPTSFRTASGRPAILAFALLNGPHIGLVGFRLSGLALSSLVLPRLICFRLARLVLLGLFGLTLSAGSRRLFLPARVRGRLGRTVFVPIGRVFGLGLRSVRNRFFGLFLVALFGPVFGPIFGLVLRAVFDAGTTLAFLQGPGRLLRIHGLFHLAIAVRGRLASGTGGLRRVVGRPNVIQSVRTLDIVTLGLGHGLAGTVRVRKLGPCFGTASGTSACSGLRALRGFPGLRLLVGVLFLFLAIRRLRTVVRLGRRRALRALVGAVATAAREALANARADAGRNRATGTAHEPRGTTGQRLVLYAENLVDEPARELLDGLHDVLADPHRRNREQNHDNDVDDERDHQDGLRRKTSERTYEDPATGGLRRRRIEVAHNREQRRRNNLVNTHQKLNRQAIRQYRPKNLQYHHDGIGQELREHLKAACHRAEHGRKNQEQPLDVREQNRHCVEKTDKGHGHHQNQRIQVIQNAENAAANQVHGIMRPAHKTGTGVLTGIHGHARSSEIRRKVIIHGHHRHRIGRTETCDLEIGLVVRAGYHAVRAP